MNINAIESSSSICGVAFFIDDKLVEIEEINKSFIHGKKLPLIINNLLNNEEVRRNFANNSFEFINNNFSWDVLLEKYTGLYES